MLGILLLMTCKDFTISVDRVVVDTDDTGATFPRPVNGLVGGKGGLILVLLRMMWLPGLRCWFPC